MVSQSLPTEQSAPPQAVAVSPLSPLHEALAGVERHQHARRLNEIANHPSVYPWLRGWLTDKVDLSAAAANPDNVCLVGMHGAICFAMLQPGLYDVHSMCLPAGRGRWMLGFARACLHVMFVSTPAVELLTRVPDGNLPARALCRRTGWTLEFHNPRGWIRGLDPIGADIFGLRIQDWMREADGLVQRGHDFHVKLSAEFARHYKSEATHPDDENHDRAVGMAFEMCLAKQAAKAQIFYSRWASMSDYLPFVVINLDPLTIDIQSAILIIKPDGDFWCPVVR